MEMFHSQNIGIYKNLCFICFLIAWIITCTQTTDTPITIKTSLTFSSCSTLESNPQLPSLSFAKRNSISTYETRRFCNQTSLLEVSGHPNLTWYSYSPSPDCCSNYTCHTLDMSTLTHQTKSWAIVGSNYVQIMTGVITYGPYINNTYVMEYSNPIADQDACLTEAGLEITVGLTTLNIHNGPSCSGIYMEEYCPGATF